MERKLVATTTTPCPFCGCYHEIHVIKKGIGFDEQGQPICDEGKLFVQMECAPQGNIYPYIPLELWNNRRVINK